MIQSSHRLGVVSTPNLSESSLAGWAAVLGFAALTLAQYGLAARPHSPPPKLDSDKFDDSTADETGWLD